MPSALPRYMHVFGFGWIDCRPSEWMADRIMDPAPLPVHVDLAAERARLDAAMQAWRERQNPPEVPWPAPEVPMRYVEPGALRGAPARLLSRLRAAEWRAVVTYARGTLTMAREGFTGKGADRQPKHYPARVVGSWAIRAAKGKRRIVAIWHESAGKLEPQGVLAWGDRPGFEWIGIREFEREI